MKLGSVRGIARLFRIAAGCMFWVGASGGASGFTPKAETMTSVTLESANLGAPQTRPGIDSGNGTLSVTYDGSGRLIQSYVAGAQTFVPVLVGEAISRRNNATETYPLSNPNQAAAWNVLISLNGSNHTVGGVYQNTMDSLLSSPNLRNGTQNLFANTSPSRNDVVNNVERVDFLFTGGVTAAADLAFAIMERGGGPGGFGSNEGFNVAAITALDAANVPTAFSNIVLSIADDSYTNGGAGVLAPISFDVFSYATQGGPDLDYMNEGACCPEGLAGVSILTTELVPAGTTIYGYAVFGEDVTTGGANLVDWTNPGFYPTNSGVATGIEMVATGAVLYQVIPEPSSAVLILIAGALVRRRRSRSG